MRKTCGAIILALAYVTSAGAEYEAGQRAWDAGQRDEAIAEWRAGADAGEAKSMLALGRLYLQGLGVPQNYIRAHMWFNLAASQGEAAAMTERDALAAKLAPEALAEAQNLALAWQPGSGQTWASTATARINKGVEIGQVFRDCPTCPQLVVVPAGSYMMGSPAHEEGRSDVEGPVHRVTIAEPFAVGVYEVTFGEWDACASGGGCRNVLYDAGWGRGRRPVIHVSWQGARDYVEWLSWQTGKTYRLLSEAEWEYVARAGTQTSRYWGESEAGQCQHENGADQTLRRNNDDVDWVSFATCDDGHSWTAPVGSYRANRFRLYDVLGNVFEWVQDCWNDSYVDAPSDGRVWESGDCSSRVVRGGTWERDPSVLRSAARGRVPTNMVGPTSDSVLPGRSLNSCVFISLLQGSRGF